MRILARQAGGWLMMGGCGAILIAFLLWSNRTPVREPTNPVQGKLAPELQAAQQAESQPERAIQLYEQFASQPAKTDEERYQVGYAHYQIGRLYAERKQFRQARQAFHRLSERPLTIPASPMEPGFGTWSEQGAYQAAICAYQADPKAGIQQMIDFMNRFPDSPLVYGAYKRILRWTNEQAPPEAEHAWHKVQAIQKEKRKRAAACGPQALAYLLKPYGQEVDWKVLMQECGTTAQGTDLWSLAEAARKRGISCTGLEVSKAGLLEQVPPFLIWSEEGHYQVVETGQSGAWQVYDPQTGKHTPFITWSLPENWRGIVLVIRGWGILPQPQRSFLEQEAQAIRR